MLILTLCLSIICMSNAKTFRDLCRTSPPGDISVHSSRLVHGSGPNKSERWRRGLTVSYMPASMRVVAPERDIAAPMGGVPAGQFAYPCVITVITTWRCSRQELGALNSSSHVPRAQLCRYLYLLRGSGVLGVNDGSPRNFNWNPRPIFQHGHHMPFDGYEDYLPDHGIPVQENYLPRL